VDVRKRLLEDARSFANEVTSLDEEGFIHRTLAVLGIPSKDSDTRPENEEVAPGAGRSQRPAPPGAPAPDLFVKQTNK
jgi:hypothetical protein